MVHKRTYKLPMPLLAMLSLDGDSSTNSNVASAEEARSLEQAYLARRPIYSDVSSFSDPDPSLLEFDFSGLDPNWSDKEELVDSNDEEEISRNDLSLEKDTGSICLGGGGM